MSADLNFWDSALAVAATIYAIYWTAKEILKHKPKVGVLSRFFLQFPLSFADAIFTPIMLSAGVVHLLLNSRLWLMREIHAENVSILIVVTFVTQVIRSYSVRLKALAQMGWNSYINTIHTGVANVAFYLVLYGALISDNWALRAVAYTLAGLNIVRLLRYRLGDDFAGHPIFTAELRFHDKFIVLVLDISLRTILSFSLSFCCICLLLNGSEANLSQKANQAVFHVQNPSGSLLIDFFYFAIVSITTVGFGDISPINDVSKIITMIYLTVSYLLLASIIGIAVSVTLSESRSAD